MIAHETGHFLGLPDLYDYTSPGRGIGYWSLMANSWGFDGSQRYPPMMDPWCKIQLGWANLKTLTDSCTDNRLYPYKKILEPSYTSHEYYKIETGMPSNEYLVVENRQAIGYDMLIPQVRLQFLIAVAPTSKD